MECNESIEGAGEAAQESGGAFYKSEDEDGEPMELFKEWTEVADFKEDANMQFKKEEESSIQEQITVDDGEHLLFKTP